MMNGHGVVVRRRLIFAHQFCSSPCILILTQKRKGERVFINHNHNHNHNDIEEYSQVPVRHIFIWN
jgi:hypothetical protein